MVKNMKQKKHKGLVRRIFYASLLASMISCSPYSDSSFQRAVKKEIGAINNDRIKYGKFYWNGDLTWRADYGTEEVPSDLYEEGRITRIKWRKIDLEGMVNKYKRQNNDNIFDAIHSGVVISVFKELGKKYKDVGVGYACTEMTVKDPDTREGQRRSYSSDKPDQEMYAFYYTNDDGWKLVKGDRSEWYGIAREVFRDIANGAKVGNFKRYCE